MGNASPSFASCATWSLFLMLASCAAPEPAATGPDAERAARRAATEAWRAEHEQKLAGETGYLALSALEWLREGTNTFGSGEDVDVRLTDASLPLECGVFHVSNGHVSVEVHPGVEVRHDGLAVSTLDLADDADGPPTRLDAARLQFWVIDRDGRLGVRVRDPQSPIRATFRGLSWWDVDDAWRVEGRWERFAVPAPLQIPNILGSTFDDVAPGTITFELDGTTHRLTPTGDPADELFVVFGDATNGESTYGGGRFLRVPPPDADGRVILDFNRAYNPPCAFSPYTTCPLPPPGNVLPVAIEAGERAYTGPEPHRL